MPTAKVNGKDVEFEQGMTVLQVCERAGKEIPRFCYHERLEIAGNCRMCLVEVEGGPPKPAASCALPAADGMSIRTDSPMVKKAREGVMEFLLANHPLDCPICDQGGECDLQDQAMGYGRSESRFEEQKRAVKEKYMGPLIKTHMTRCIHCTRCVRFLDDVAGVHELGAVYRGENMQISTYVEKSLTSEMSGNIIDLCPVGALTSRPYAFKARPWELRKVESVDVLDAVGSNIRVDVRGNEVMRILPRLNESVNEEWISDKTRFSYDGLSLQRLDRPYVKKDGRLTPVSWDEALSVVSDKLKTIHGQKIAALTGDLVGCEAQWSLKSLWQELRSPHIDCRQDGSISDTANPASYRFNTTIEGIEQADVCLLIGSNPRKEGAIINARLRKSQVKHGLTIASIGEKVDTTTQTQWLGDNPEVISELVSGKHAFSNVLKAAKNPMIIIGSGVFSREDAGALLHEIQMLIERYKIVRDDWNGYNVLQTAASRVGGLDMGLVPSEGGRDTNAIVKAANHGDIELLYLLGVDEIDSLDADSACFVIYQGHHGDRGAHLADVILPSAAYTEQDATYVNTEGRVQRSHAAVPPVGEAKADVDILLAIAGALDIDLGFGCTQTVRQVIEKALPYMAHIDEVETFNLRPLGTKGSVSHEVLSSSVDNFYQSNAISRASKIMAKCVKEIADNHSKEAA